MSRDTALNVVPLRDQPVCGGETASGSPCRRQVKAQGRRCPQHDRAMSVTEAAGESRRSLLTSLRDKIASDIDEGVPARDLASLSKRLLDISKELDDLSTAQDGDDINSAAETPDEPWSG